MEFKADRPIYLQIAEGIMDAILAGTYGPGGRLPSVREYGARVEVNFNTVVRSYEWLQQQGIIFNRRGIGFFVADEAPKIIVDKRREVFFRDEVTYFFSRIDSFGLTPEALADLYRNYLASKKS